MAGGAGEWRREAAPIIARVLAGLPPGATVAAKRRALREAYPWGPRRHHPYRMWCKEVRIALGLRPGGRDGDRPGPTRVTPDGVFCPWCVGAACLACFNARVQFAAAAPAFRAEWSAWLALLNADPGDRTGRLALADWLAEHGQDEAARQQREEVNRA